MSGAAFIRYALSLIDPGLSWRERFGTGAAGEGWTNLFIRPPFEFRAVDRLITNFHLPRSSLLMLVASFGGLKPVLAAYAHAVDSGYRVYSDGDAMLLT